MNSTKKVILIITICITPFLILIIGRILKFYILYTVPTAGMEPNIKVHQTLFASSILTPKRNDAVSYNGNPSGIEGEELTQRMEILGRIVAIENDTLEIKNGLLYINNRFVDDTMNLSYNYFLSQNDANTYFTKQQLATKIFPYTSDSVYINLSPKELVESKIPQDKFSMRVINDEIGYIRPELFNCNSELKWSPDNFGPVIVPKDNFFIMGDNRGNSADSRYRGFVNKNDIIAVIIK